MGKYVTTKHMISVVLGVVMILIALSTGICVSKTVEVSVWRVGYPDRDPQFFGPLVPAFEKKYPNIKVRVVHGGWGELMKKAPIYLATGGKGLPDVFFADARRGVQDILAGVRIPLTKYVDKELLDMMPPGFLERRGMWKGDIYQIPVEPCGYVIYYHKDLFEEAGLDPERPPKTWDEFREYAVKITENTEAAGFGMPMDMGGDPVNIPNFFGSVYYTLSEQRYTDENGKALFNGPEGVKALKYIQDLHRKYKVTQPNPYEWARGDLRYQLRDKHIAFHHDGGHAIPSLREVYDFSSEKACRIGLSLVPAWKEGGPIHGYSGTNGWNICGPCKHPEEAWKLLRFMVRPKWAALHCQVFGPSPYMKEVFELMPEESKWYYEVLVKANVAALTVDFEFTKGTEALTILAKAIEKAVMDGESVEKVLDEAATKINAL